MFSLVVVFCCLLIFQKMNLKSSSRNTSRKSNSLDPVQIKNFVRPDLGSNCLQMLLADNKPSLAGDGLYDQL